MTPEIKVMPPDYSILSQILNVKKKAVKISKQIYLYIQVLIKSQLCARQCSEYWGYSSTQPKSWLRGIHILMEALRPQKRGLGRGSEEDSSERGV